MAEASFLASQRLRTAKLSSRSKEKSERLSAFWASFKAQISSWNNRLAHVAAIDDPPRLESEKLTVHLKLKELAVELKDLRKLCLSAYHHGATAIAISAPPDDLPVTDVRLLHREFTACQSALDGTRSKLLPKGKFVFKRYREAMAKRSKENKLSGTKTDTKSIPSTSEPIKASWLHELDNDRTVQNLEHTNVLVLANGTVLVDSSVLQQMKNVDSSLLVLRNLSHCRVTLHGNYTSIHFVDLDNSVVTVTDVIGSAAHVTKCHDTKITLQAQQLRLHESQDLECVVRITAGAILEECTRIVFRTKQQQHLDVKDFDWLRNGVPSPNYRIEQCAEPPEATAEISTVASNKEETPRGSTTACANGPFVNKGKISGAKAIVDDDESDDEL